ncbi:MAG: hypothetical protein KDD45_13085, partial [Bdellovibrionales bacterium]|nr:hypothetical protein [Bdellovibrionales bacterium]
MKFKSLSIKSKFFILFFFIPFLALVAYYFLAAHLFQSDKLAYVLESQFNESQSLKSKISSDFYYLDQIVKNIIFDYDFKSKKMNPLSEKIFKAHPTLLAIYPFSENMQSFSKEPILIKNNELQKKILPTLEKNLSRLIDKNSDAFFENSFLIFVANSPAYSHFPDSRLIVILKDTFLRKHFNLQTFSFNYLTN